MMGAMRIVREIFMMDLGMSSVMRAKYFVTPAREDVSKSSGLNRLRAKIIEICARKDQYIFDEQIQFPHAPLLNA
jgi:hypothetical protein